MSNMMAVLINGIAQLEYDRDKALTDYQLTYLDEMDKKMDAGINIDGESIESPELNQRIQFITANMLSAIKSDNEGMTSALCTYLATRLPDLKQIKVVEEGEDMTIDMVFDEEYKGQTSVSFTQH
ncbi:MAG: hypothetical protein KAS57_06930 [Gammaproteobacteria bacterium]|nr:hypothetical protein [Gammaproteobacteria bacterium]